MPLLLASLFASLSARWSAAPIGPALALALALPVAMPLHAADGTDCAIEWQVRLSTANLPDAARQSSRAVPALDVTLAFDAGARTSTRLRLPAGWGALREANPDASRLQPVAGDAQLRQVLHNAQARVMLQWQLLPAGDGSDTAGLRLAPTWSAFTGAAVLPWPDEAGAQTPQPRSACLRLDAGEPVRWISNFGRAEGSSARWTWPAASADLVQQALYAGGALQWRDADAAGQTVTAVVPAGAALGFDAAVLAERSARLQAALRRDWRDDERTPITVLALPGAQASGQTLNRALVLQAPPDLALPGAAGDELIAGQLLRRWMPDRFGPLAHIGRGDGPLRAWFTEGFADYLAHRLLLREGLWTPDDYAAALNGKIARYQAQPARAADNLSLATGRAGAQALAELPAARGEWLALHWNTALREAGRPGLEATLRGLMLPAAQARREGPLSTPLATHRLIAALRRDLGDVPLRELAHHIEDGAPFSFADGALGPCFQAQPGRSEAQGAQFRPVAGAPAACQGRLQGSGNQRMAAAGPAAAVAADTATGRAGKSAKSGKAAKGAKAGKGGKGGKAAHGASGRAGKTGKAGASAAKSSGKSAGRSAGRSSPGKGGGKAVPAGGARKPKARH